MKKILTLMFLIGGLTGALAQGTLQFSANISSANELSPNSSGIFGTGTFTLTGDSLDFSISVEPAFFPSDAGVFGPATAGQTNSMVFDLGTPVIGAPGPGEPTGGVGYGGTVTLTLQQINYLEDGNLYVNILTSTYPDGAARGQITPVPEPSALALLGLGIGGIGLWSRRKTR